MKIINETCYSSEDIRNLFDATYKLASESLAHHDGLAKSRAHQTGTSYKESWFQQRPKPVELRIGYYKQTKRKKAAKKAVKNPFKDRGPSYTRVSRGRTVFPRIGICRPVEFPVSPLEILAQCAEGANGVMPREVVSQLLVSMRPLYSCYLTEEERAALVDQCPITFSFDTEPSDVAEVKAAVKRADLGFVEQQISLTRTKIVKIQARLTKEEKKLEVLYTRLSKLRGTVAHV